ncbi:cell division FtsA domain-containing protein [Methanolobus sp. ZRKC2]|uniref:cell division FtsA domain-containing protein n=1 Tax=Methanolobus sp. ZRKC2 TaxID=3125783 RepID=UPI003247C64E
MSATHFALDIGTRTVVGLIVGEEEPLEIKAACILEHNERSMYDGQIHDVDRVAEVVRKVKNELEKQVNYELTGVSVAVAGRALRTSKVKVSIDLPYREITEKDISELEFEAVARAGSELDCDERFNCVGYSIVGYELEGQKISSLEGHTGSSISIELLATFLPETVVNSMFAVLDRCGLEAENVTLEPIAALNIAIPRDTRKINLALVDIGAGTSDIAVTSDGTVVGYGMVPEAGDEITDFICDHYLLDFKKGEEIKQQLLTEDKIEIQDIFGVTTEIQTSEVISVIAEEVDKLAFHISEEIVSINGKVPRAVVLVGGGSQTATLRERLSDHLGIPVQRIGSRLPGMIEELKDSTGKVNGAEMITPLGIALTAIRNSGIDFVEVSVNDNNVHLMDLNGLSVMDALVATHVKKMYPRPGLALTLKVNSGFMTIEGDSGKHASIMVDGKKASLGDVISSGSKIEFNPPVDGKDASITAQQLAARAGIPIDVDITINSKQVRQAPFIQVNGKRTALNDAIPDRAEVTITPATLKEVLHAWTDSDPDEKLQITLNKKARVLNKKEYVVKLNGIPVDPKDFSDTIIKDEDVLQISKKDIKWTYADIIDPPQAGKNISVMLNNEKVTFEGTDSFIRVNGKKVLPSERIFDGDNIILEEGSETNPILSDLFEFMDIRREELVGKSISLFVNNCQSRFTTPLKDGDKVTIEFLEV